MDDTVEEALSSEKSLIAIKSLMWNVLENAVGKGGIFSVRRGTDSIENEGLLSKVECALCRIDATKHWPLHAAPCI